MFAAPGVGACMAQSLMLMSVSVPDASRPSVLPRKGTPRNALSSAPSSVNG